jgi:hypothetical protein
LKPTIPPPVPPRAELGFGASPFRAKGVLYIGTQSFFDERLTGGMAALADEIAEPELRAFITQKFLPASWYDVMPVPALIAYEARALRMSLEAYLLFRTRWQAKADLSGVRGYLLRLASPALVASQLPKVMMQMFDFARAEVVKEGERESEVRFHDVPLPLHPWLETSLAVYAETAMRLAGAASIDCPPAVSTPTGHKAGVPLGVLAVRLRWETR